MILSISPVQSQPVRSQSNGEVALGSLDLINPQKRLEGIAVAAKAAEAHGETERETWTALPHGSFDLVMMNPPFTRATGHEGKKVGVHNPMFAAFRADKETQQTMGRLTKELTAKTSAHGNAGEASIFLVLADKKLKEGGTVALVMPLSLMIGDSWQPSRDLFVTRYADLILVSNAGLGGRPVSFSADTDMGECLIVGRKNAGGSSRATFVVLNERPESNSAGANIAAQIQHLRKLGRMRRLEDGPVGGVPIRLGNEIIGQAIDGPVPAGQPWNLTRIKDISLAQTAYQLCAGTVWLPAMQRGEAFTIAVTTVGEIGTIGPYHADINGSTAKGGVRGPLEITPTSSPQMATYPVLWSHDAIKERYLCFDADSEGIAKVGETASEQALIDRKLDDIWATASYCHFNRDFRFNSQSTSMQATRYRAVGGRAWTSISLQSEKLEKALVLWSNTTFGLLIYWWLANKQQDGRGSIGKNSLADLIVFDVASLPAETLDEAVAVFDEFADVELLPMHQMHTDKVRENLDEAFVRRVLGVNQWQNLIKKLELVRMKLANEPSVIGHKVDKTPSVVVSGELQPELVGALQRTPQVEFNF